jgi:hypothetical protein
LIGLDSMVISCKLQHSFCISCSPFETIHSPTERWMDLQFHLKLFDLYSIQEMVESRLNEMQLDMYQNMKPSS